MTEMPISNSIPAVFLADLLRALRVLAPDTSEECRAIAEVLGFELWQDEISPRQEQSQAAGAEPLPSGGIAPLGTVVGQSERATETAPPQPAITSPPTAKQYESARRLTAGGKPVPSKLVREPVSHQLVEPLKNAKSIDEHFPPVELDEVPSEGLFRPAWRRSILTSALSIVMPEGQLDIDRIVGALTAGEALGDLPRESVPTTRQGVLILLDIAESMVPFAKDQARLRKDVANVMGRDGVRDWRFESCPTFGVGEGPRTKWSPTYQPPPPGKPVLLITDFGIGKPADSRDCAHPADWLDFAEVNRRAGCPVIAFVPHPPARWPDYLRSVFRMVHWDYATSIGTLRRLTSMREVSCFSEADRKQRQEEVRLLAKVLSLAVRVEPGLVRGARLEFLPGSDASVEADLWFSPFVESQSPLGIVLEPAIQAYFRAEIATKPDLLERASSVIDKFHRDAPPSIRLEERLVRLTLQTGQLIEKEMEDLLASALSAIIRDNAPDVSRWVIRALGHMPPFPENSTVSEMRSLLQITAAAHLGKPWDLSVLSSVDKDRNWSPWLLQKVPRTSTRVRLCEGSIEIGEISGNAHTLELARTDPLVVQLSWVDGNQSHVERVQFSPGSSVVLECHSSSVEILTSLGEKFRLTRMREAQRTPKPTKPSPILKPAFMISHTATESYLAEAWQKLLCDVFGLAQESVWFSSEPTAIGAMRPFADSIENSIRSAQAIISIQSPVSRFRPWLIWEAGMARALSKPVYVIVYELSNTARHDSIFGNLGTSFDAFQHFRGTDLKHVKDSVLRLLQADISRPINLERLDDALRKYKETVEPWETSWVLDVTIFEKRIELVFGPSERQELAQRAVILDTVYVKGAMDIFDLTVARINWRDFMSHLAALQVPLGGSAERWARSLNIALQRALAGLLVQAPEGLPLYFHARERHAYRPAVSAREDHGRETVFTISFTLIPPELTANPKSSAGVLLHYLDFCRMWRWGVLEDPDISAFFRNFHQDSTQESKARIRDLLERAFSIRTELWNRGLEKDSIFQAINREDQRKLDNILQRYYEVIRMIDPNDQGVVPSPLPEFRLLRHVYSELLSVNKELYLLVIKTLGQELEKLAGSIEEMS